MHSLPRISHTMQAQENGGMDAEGHRYPLRDRDAVRMQPFNAAHEPSRCGTSPAAAPGGFHAPAVPTQPLVLPKP